MMLEDRRYILGLAAGAAGLALMYHPVVFLWKRIKQKQLRGNELPLLRTEIPGPRSVEIISRLSLHECPAITAGHGNDTVRAAIVQQLQIPLLHAMGDAFACETRVKLLEGLVSFFPGPQKADGGEQMGHAILGCSGSDAVQAAIKTAVLATGRQGVLGFTGGYHGLAYGALGCTAYKQSDFREPFKMQMEGLAGGVSAWSFAEYGALPLPPLRAAGIGCVVVEAVQGRGGIRSPPDGWLTMLRDHCTREGALLVFDEIYTGFGRTGAWFAYQAADDGTIQPDMVCVGKALGGGLPLSACVGTRRVMEAWGASKGEALHTQTFLGNPVACAAGCAALAELRRIDAPALARRKGLALRRYLSDAGFSRVRGKGLMLAVEVPDPLKAMAGLLQRGVIGLPCGEGEYFAMAIVPPLTISYQQMRHTAQALADVFASS